MSSWMSLKNFYLLNFTSVYYKNILPYILPIYLQNILPNTQTVATWHFSDLDPGFQSNKPNEGNIYSWQGLSLCELCLKFKPIYHLLICFSFQITRKKKKKAQNHQFIVTDWYKTSMFATPCSLSLAQPDTELSTLSRCSGTDAVFMIHAIWVPSKNHPTGKWKNAQKKNQTPVRVPHSQKS